MNTVNKRSALAEAFVRLRNVVADWEGEEELAEEWRHLMLELGEADRSTVLQAIMETSLREGDHGFTMFSKRFAVQVADDLGPENAQRLYRFAVLVTKLA